MFVIIEDYGSGDIVVARRKGRKDAFALARALRQQATTSVFYVRRVKPARKQGRKKF